MTSIAMVFGIFKLLRRRFYIENCDFRLHELIDNRNFSFNVLFNQTGCIYRLLVSNMHYNDITQESI